MLVHLEQSAGWCRRSTAWQIAPVVSCVIVPRGACEAPSILGAAGAAIITTTFALVLRACLLHTLQVVFKEASAVAGHTIDRVVSIMDANGLTLSALTGFAQRVRVGNRGRPGALALFGCVCMAVLKCVRVTMPRRLLSKVFIVCCHICFSQVHSTRQKFLHPLPLHVLRLWCAMLRCAACSCFG